MYDYEESNKGVTYEVKQITFQGLKSLYTITIKIKENFGN